MKKAIKIILVLTLISLITFNTGQSADANDAKAVDMAETLKDKGINKSKKIIGYYPSWKAYSGYTPDKVDTSKLTHINYAFANIDDDLKVSMGYPDKDPQNFKILQDLKKDNPNLKTLISVGGWNWSGKFSDVALSEASRTKFARSCVEFITEHGFDGVDLDWEYPVGGGLETNKNRPEDKQNFTMLLKEIREQLDDEGLKDNKHYLLTIAAGASNYYIGNTEVNKFSDYLDYVNIMTYDLHGTWDALADFNAPLYDNKDNSNQYKISIDSSVNVWLKAGLPKDKLVVGVPFYGYEYNVSENINNGLYQKFSGGKSLSYDSIAKNYLNKPEFVKYFHEESLVPYLSSESIFISYDDAQSIGLKAKYILDNNLGGAMIWELSQDSEGVLLNALFNGMQGIQYKDYKGHWAEATIDKWFNEGHISGYPDGSFRPEEYMTRAEFLKIVNNVFRFSETTEIDFVDVNINDWYYEEVKTAFKNEYILGISETQFAPNDFITREQAAIVISKILKLEGDESDANKFVDFSQINLWAKEYVGAASENQLINGYEDNSFKPQNNIKRAEAITILDRVLKKISIENE